MSYASGPSASPLLGRTIGGDLAATVARFGDREALVDVPTGRRWTYRELDAEVDRVARGMLDLGIEKGDRVGIWSPNCAEWVLVQYATAKIGAILVNVNPAYRTHELQFVLRQSGTKLLVAAPSFKTSDYAAMIDEVRGECPALEVAILLGSSDWDDLLARGDRADAGALERAAPRSASTIRSTSSTRRARRVPEGRDALAPQHPQQRLLRRRELLGYTEEDRVCLPVPFYHCFGMVMGNLGATSHGACIVIPAPAFDPAATLQAVQDERCTSLYGVPTMFIAELALADFPTYDLARCAPGSWPGRRARSR